MFSSDDSDQTARRHAADRRLAQALTLIEEAARDGVRLRLAGGLAAYRHAVDRDFMAREFSDIDVVGCSAEAARLPRVLARMGYRENQHVAQATAGGQLQFVRPLDRAEHLDVFLDVIRMDHDVDLRGRLDIDPWAISPADVLLSKLQIGRLADKDVHDVSGLLKDLPLGEGDDARSICVRRIARACARDWGTFVDVCANLDTVAAVARYDVPATQRAPLVRRLAGLQEAFALEDKSLRFRLRATVGKRLPWRREVEERDGSPLVAPRSAA
jgi:hypothetical protein